MGYFGDNQGFIAAGEMSFRLDESELELQKLRKKLAGQKASLAGIMSKARLFARQRDREREQAKVAIKEKETEIDRLNARINDLQSGMYINCVYCGHRQYALAGKGKRIEAVGGA